MGERDITSFFCIWKTRHLESLTKKSWVAILISDKADIEPRIVTRDTEQLFKMIKYTIYQEARTILFLYAANNLASKYIKHKPVHLISGIKGVGFVDLYRNQ